MPIYWVVTFVIFVVGVALFYFGAKDAGRQQGEQAIADIFPVGIGAGLVMLAVILAVLRILWNLAPIIFALTLGIGVAMAQKPAPGTVPAEGVINPAVTEATLKKTICKPGWTAEVRPPTSYTNNLKLAQIAAHPELEDRDPAHYEGDHKDGEETGGHPTDPANIRLQPWATSFGAKKHTCNPKKYGYTAECKDIVETALHRDLCPRKHGKLLSPKITLEAARDVLTGDDAKWIAELVRRYPKYALPQSAKAQ